MEVVSSTDVQPQNDFAGTIGMNANYYSVKQTVTVRSPCGMLKSVLVSDVENSAIFSSVDVGNENFKDGVGPSFRRSREVGRN